MTAAAQPFPFFHQHSALDLNLTVDMFYILQSSSLYTGLVVSVEPLWIYGNLQMHKYQRNGLRRLQIQAAGHYIDERTLIATL